MNVTISVSPEAILALKIVAAERDLREYLNGIFVEVTPKHGVLLGAADGHRMLIHKAPWEVPGIKMSAVVPTALFSGVKKSGSDVSITLSPQKENTRSRDVSVTQNGVTVAGQTMDYDPPSWRKAIKSFTGSDPRQYNPDYISDWAKVYRLLHKKVVIPQVFIHHNGSDPAFVDLGRDDFFAVLMPLIDNPKPDPDKLIPQWARL